jgi:spoIIIJ-associated protein
MPITDAVAAAKNIDSLFKRVLAQGGFRLKYRIVVNPPASPVTGEAPAILMDFSGPDSSLMLARGGELLRSFEHIIQKSLRLEHEELDKVAVDCGNQRAARAEELAMAAKVAADKVRETGRPYQFAPMNSRERRMMHMALKSETDLRTESTGEGFDRALVVYPKDYKTPATKPFTRGRR